MFGEDYGIWIMPPFNKGVKHQIKAYKGLRGSMTQATIFYSDDFNVVPLDKEKLGLLKFTGDFTIRITNARI